MFTESKESLFFGDFDYVSNTFFFIFIQDFCPRERPSVDRWEEAKFPRTQKDKQAMRSDERNTETCWNLLSLHDDGPTIRYEEGPDIRARVPSCARTTDGGFESLPARGGSFYLLPAHTASKANSFLETDLAKNPKTALDGNRMNELLQITLQLLHSTRRQVHCIDDSWLLLSTSYSTLRVP